MAVYINIDYLQCNYHNKVCEDIKMVLCACSYRPGF